jgi:beta-N-acetylhexosaminidase
VILTDDMEMKAIAARWRPGEAAALAAKAGCDVLAVCRQPDLQVEAIEGLIRALESEEIPWTRADAAQKRVRALKERYLLPYADPDPRRAKEAAGVGERVALAEEIAERSGLRA